MRKHISFNERVKQNREHLLQNEREMERLEKIF
ncbi:FbpB family small basic protein [Shouchella lonarensis]